MSIKKYPNSDIPIGARLKQARKDRGLTLVQLSKLIDISHGSLSDIENGKTKPAADTLSSICRNTDINIHWLLTGDSDQATMQKSQSYRGQSIEDEVLADVITVVEEWLTTNQRILPPDKKAKVISYLYEEYMEQEGNIDPETTDRILRLVA